MNRLHRWLCASALWKYALERRLLPWALDGVVLGDDVLEIGPGPGLTTDVLRARAPRMTALEIDPRLATSLSRRLAGSNVRVVEGDAGRMPFEDGAFSSVISLTMLHHVPSTALQDRVFGQAHRVLRAGGVFAGTDSTRGLAFRLLHVGDTMVTVDPGTLGARLAAAGFEEVVVGRARGRFRFRARKAARPRTRSSATIISGAGPRRARRESRRMSEDANKQVVLAYVDAFNRGDEEALERLFTSDALVYGVLGAGGLDVVMPIWRELHSALSATLEVEAITAEGDTVAVRYRERGTSVGPFRGQPATGRSYEIVAMEWFTLKDGLIHRRWGARDSAAQARQMGLLA